MARSKMVLQFRILLVDISPKIWRRILVPEKYTFWDLHVAIQDSMGWLDYHLHEFSISKSKAQNVIIGIPDDDRDDKTTKPGWNVALAKYFNRDYALNNTNNVREG